MPDSIGPVREPTERSWHILHRPDWGHERDVLLPHDAAIPSTGLVDVIEVVPVAEVERLRAERRELREALAFYDPHAPAAIEHECRNAS
jgi:hypothetical protein